MAGLVPAIHVLGGSECCKNVDARHKAGHDGVTLPELIKSSIGQIGRGAEAAGAFMNLSEV
jgi:hypothetical protein